LAVAPGLCHHSFGVEMLKGKKPKHKLKFSMLKEIASEIALAKGGSHIKVGILAAEGSIKPPGSNINFAGIASVNEFGTKTAGKNRNVTVPARPFLSTTFETKLRSFTNMTNKQILEILNGRQSTKGALDKLGVIFSAEVKNTITRLKTPPNAPSTIARKGSSNPLIDTSRMRNSVAHETIMKKRKLGIKAFLEGVL